MELKKKLIIFCMAAKQQYILCAEQNIYLLFPRSG